MPRLILILCITVALAGGASAQPGKAASAGGWLKAGDVVIEDFEDDFKISPASATADPAHWQSTGDAFTGVHSADSRFATGAGVAEGYAWACGEKVIYSSRGWGHRTLSGAATGTLTSPAFTVEKGYLSFLIGGAQNLQALAVQLVHKGRVVRAATGTGHIALRMVAFDLRELKGEQVQIRLVDQLRGADAVLIADRFVQTDEPPTSEVIAQPPPQTPWVVHTRKGMLHGEVVLQGEQLTVGGEVVAPQTVLSLTNPNVGGRQVTLSGVRLRNGELWSGEVRGYRNGIVQIEGVFGVRDLELSEVSSLIFDGSIPVHAQAPDTLHLIERDPLPGKLVWVKDKDIAVDCALGILPVPRPQIAQFVVEAVSNKAADPDLIQIGLTDGSILYSKALQITDGMLQIKHPVLGDFGLGLDRIASLRRSPEDAFWLAEPGRSTGLDRRGGLSGAARERSGKGAGVSACIALVSDDHRGLRTA